ncbi:hypothetical protein D1872_313880 [compost metagenome]
MGNPDGKAAQKMAQCNFPGSNRRAEHPGHGPTTAFLQDFADGAPYQIHQKHQGKAGHYIQPRLRIQLKVGLGGADGVFLRLVQNRAESFPNVLSLC